MLVAACHSIGVCFSTSLCPSALVRLLKGKDYTGAVRTFPLSDAVLSKFEGLVIRLRFQPTVAVKVKGKSREEHAIDFSLWDFDRVRYPGFKYQNTQHQAGT